MNARKGMTLMELVVALAITGMMAAMGAATFSSIIDHRRIIVGSTGELERASALRDQIRTWMLAGSVQVTTGGATRGIGRGFASIGGNSTAFTASSLQQSSTMNGTGITAAVAGGDEITFVTTAPNPANAPSVRMRLFVDADPNTPESGLTLEYQPSTSTPLKRIQLEPSIGVLKVEFLDQRTNQWFESTQGAAVTPIAVRISMQPYDGGRLPGILELPMIFPIGTLTVGR
jgi:prepilin-type N-terminal cleavage/methylation domain-containing protein